MTATKQVAGCVCEMGEAAAGKEREREGEKERARTAEYQRATDQQVTKRKDQELEEMDTIAIEHSQEEASVIAVSTGRQKTNAVRLGADDSPKEERYM